MPTAVIGVVAGGPAAVALVPAGAAASLPPLTAAELLQKIHNAQSVAGFSGTVTVSTDLGLPQLPAAAVAGGASAMGLLSGDHSVRVWSAGPEHSRVALLDTFAETEVVRSGSEMWTFDSTKNAVSHLRLPDRSAVRAGSDGGTEEGESSEPDSPEGGSDAVESPGGAAHDGAAHDGAAPGGLEALTPQDAAAKVLAAIDSTTEVTVADAAMVAGRAAYELRVAPRSATSLVDNVVLAVDSDTWLPLRVAVTARGQRTPAVDLRFTQISFDVPSAARFQFSPPKGATVQERSLGGRSDSSASPDASSQDAAPAPAPPAAGRPDVMGSGWDSVTVARGVDLGAVTGTAPAAAGSGRAGAAGAGSAAPKSAGPEGGGGQPDVAGMLNQATRPVTGAFGEGRLLTTSLLTALITNDGRVYAGAVTPEALLAVASAHS